MKQTINWLKLTFVFLVLSGCTQSEPMVSTLISPSVYNSFCQLVQVISNFYRNSSNPRIAGKPLRQKTLHRLKNFTVWVMGRLKELDISPDDSMLAVGSTTGLQVYDLTTFELMFEDTDNWSDTVDWSPDSARLVSGHYDGSVSIWDVSNKKKIFSLPSDDRVRSVNWSPDGEQIVIASWTNTIILNTINYEVNSEDVSGSFWTSDSQNLLLRNGHSHNDVFVVDSGEIAYDEFDETDQYIGNAVYVQGANPGDVVALFKDGERTYIIGEGFSKEFFQVEGNAFLYSDYRYLYKYDIETEESKKILTYDWNIYSRRMDWTSDLSVFVSGGIYGNLVIVDLDSRQEIGALAGYYCCLWRVAFFPDMRQVAYKSDTTDQNMSIWDFTNQFQTLVEPEDFVETHQLFSKKGGPITFERLLGPVPVENWPESPRRVKSAVLSTNEFYLAAKHDLGDIRVWDVSSGAVILDFPMMFDQYYRNDIAWSPVGSLLAYNTLDSLVLWDAEIQQDVAILSGFFEGIEDIAWSADGTQIATAGEDGTIRIWGIP